METVKLGSLYFNGSLVSSGAKFYQGIISIGETVPRMALTWNVVGSRLVANQTVCDNISWNQLCEAGYVNGHPDQIDGKFYLCRCLSVGKQTGDPNEWDELLDQYGEDNDLWHWLGTAFWGQEEAEGHPDYRSARGKTSPRLWGLYHKNDRHIYLGFRPILEPLPPEPELEELSTGTKIKVYGPSGAAVVGKLAGLDDYDLTLASAKVPAGCSWAGKANDGSIISRNGIVFLQEV